MLNYLHKTERLALRAFAGGNERGVVVKPRSKPTVPGAFFALSCAEGVLNGLAQVSGGVRLAAVRIRSVVIHHPRSVVGGGRVRPMMFPPEIKTGDFIVIADTRPGPFAPKERPPFDGRPFEVRAVDLPFIVVADGLHRFSIDVRAWSLQKASSGYVRAYLHPVCVETNHVPLTRSRITDLAMRP